MQTQILPKSPIFKNVKYVYEPHLLWAVTNFAKFSHNFLDLKMLETVLHIKQPTFLPQSPIS